MIIMHIDVNSAFLSWTAVQLLEEGFPVDIRNEVSVIAGDPKNRHGIVLAKSTPAKKYKIKTGESLMEARKKCPELKVYAPDYNLYMKCSNNMYNLLCEYSPRIQRYSIDECFLDYTNSKKYFGDPIIVAHQIRNRIKEELGFTVNVGVAYNKLLAKMAGELKKPDMVHSLFPNEIQKKLWPLDVGELFMVGRATERKLRNLNISTIGDLACADKNHLRALLKSHGELIWNYANGIDNSEVVLNDDVVQKSIGNSTTTKSNITTVVEARRYLLGLCERVGMRLRKLPTKASLVSVHFRTKDFEGNRRQVQLQSYFDGTDEIYKIACLLFDEIWRGEEIRQIGVSVGNFKYEENEQLSMFDNKDNKKSDELNKVVDEIRKSFGKEAIVRGTFVNTNTRAIQGGVNDGNYLMMGGQRNENTSNKD